MRSLGWLLLAITACGVEPVTPRESATVSIVPSATASASATTSVAPEPAPPILSPVGRVYALLDVALTDGGPELRIGIDQGGGTRGYFRYVPLVDGVPDFARETSEIFHADTTNFGYVDIAGKRPNLLLHAVAGFRSSAGETYQVLDEDNVWHYERPKALPGIGMGIFPWTNGKQLEVRGPQPEAAPDLTVILPSFRVFQGTDNKAPELPAALAKRLTKEGFIVSTFSTLETGEVLAVGSLEAGGFGTLLWASDLKAPVYSVTEGPKLDRGDVYFLGGTTMAGIRLRAFDDVYKREGTGWVKESKVPEKGFPDAWFGKPQFEETEQGILVRMSKSSPWQKLELEGWDKADRTSLLVDNDGVLWATVDDVLYASKKFTKSFDVSEKDLIERRKKSILGRGSDDASGVRPDANTGASRCRMHYVLLHRAKADAAPKDLPADIRAVLKKFPELAGRKLIVTRERGWQFIGLAVQKWEDGNKIEEALKKKSKTSDADVMCAEPPAEREIPIGF